VARTLNSTLHSVRRDAFLDVAQRLIETKGYEAMSVQDVLDALEVSKGAFYHYFASKPALLEAVVERFAEGGMAAIAPVLNDPRLPAIAKLERVFSGIAGWKAERKELVLGIVEVWNSDSNAIVREKVRRLTVRLMVPRLAAVVRQGIAEGVFNAESADETAAVLVALLQGAQEQATHLFIARQARTIPYEVVERTFAGFTQAFERILGIRQGSLTLQDKATLHFWFG
jgi:AcrR family transcriptional regulator